MLINKGYLLCCNKSHCAWNEKRFYKNYHDECAILSPCIYQALLLYLDLYFYIYSKKSKFIRFAGSFFDFICKRNYHTIFVTQYVWENTEWMWNSRCIKSARRTFASLYIENYLLFLWLYIIAYFLSLLIFFWSTPIYI